jgi:hypothetical protein
MAFIVPTRRGKFELRESRSTPKGPRARTLATFGELSDEVIERAQAKAGKRLDPDLLRAAARRVGAPVEPSPADRAARELIAELGKGTGPQPKLRRLLTSLLNENHRATAPGDPGEAVAEWIAATPAERGSSLVDLLLLGDALPHRGRRGEPLRFPRLESAPRSA